MTQRSDVFRNIMTGVMLLLTGLASLAVIAMRVWLTPAVRDWETGLFSTNYWVIGLMLVCLVALVVMGRLCGTNRREITGRCSVAMGVVLLLTGVTLAVSEVLSLLGAFPNLTNAISMLGFMPDGVSLFSPSLQVLQNVIGVASGCMLVLLSMRLFSEGATRRGIAQWSVLLPVVWMWLRLVNYEMSYASMVRIEDSFFGFVMMLLEMWFLFKLARYVAGVGNVSMGSLLACSLSTAMFALTAPVVRLCMYLLQDYAAYEASLATAVDFVVGVLATGVALALAFSHKEVQESSSKASDSTEVLPASDAFIVADLIDVSPDEEGASDETSAE